MKSCQVFCDKALILPEEDKFKFQNFRMYLESFFKLFFWLLPSLEGQSTNVKNSTHLKYTTLKGSNLIAGYGIVIYDTNDKVYYMNTYVGEHAMENFICQFQEKTNEIKLVVASSWVPINYSGEDMEAKIDSKICSFCNEFYNFKTRYPVFHHHHMNGRFHDGKTVHIICNACNLKIVKSAIACMSHNWCTRF
jgi:hypothetical protein